MGDETRREHRIELFATILLASAAVATAWSTYQSNRWRGEQTSSSSAAIRAQVTGISTKLRSLRQREVLLALGWAIFVVTLVWIATSPISFSI